MIRILAAAQDPGGAEALAPVLLSLEAESRVLIKILARAQAAAVFRDSGLEFEAADDLSDHAAAKYFGLFNPDMAVVATSLGGTLERTMVAAARSHSVPSLAVLDSWTNYRARFADDGCSLSDSIPDRIAVPDNLARDEMLAAGMPREVLTVTGQPAFDALAERISDDDASVRNKVRAELAVPKGETLVMFFSQPIRMMYGDPSGARGRGYDEFDALTCLADALASVDHPVCFMVKPHPREERDAVADSLASLAIPARLVDDVDPNELMLASDIVCGMTSIMLVKAWLAGRRVISIQPSLRGHDALSLTRAGHIKTATDPLLIDVFLREAIDAGSRSPPASSLKKGEATAQVTALALSMAEGRATAEP